MTNPDSVLKSRDITLLTKVSISCGFFLVVVYGFELNHKENWVPKNWCFQIVVLEKPLESPLDCKEITSANPKGNQPWTLTGSTDAYAVMLWPPDAKSWLIGKIMMLGKIEGKRRRGQQRMRCLESIIDSIVMNLSKLWETVKDWEPGRLKSMGLQRVRHNWATEQQPYASCVSLCSCHLLSYKDTSSTGLGAHPAPIWPPLN